MKFLIQITLIIITASTILSSCASRKNMVYFQTGEFDSIVESAELYEMRFRKGDFLHIQVSGATSDAVEIFNPPIINTRENFTGSYIYDNPQTTGYVIDNNGDINFPVIGKINAAGKTKLELEKILIDNLDGHIDMPVLNIRIRNFKVSVLGDVARPGTFTISSERVTLPEVLGIAGDLNITAKRKNVLVLRETDGIKKQYRIDLTKNEVFNSPVYYLQQNDVIYVEPNQAKMNTSKFSPVYSVLISVTSLIITTVVVITSN